MQYPLPVGRVAVGDEYRLVGQVLQVLVLPADPVVRVTSPSEEFADPAVAVAGVAPSVRLDMLLLGLTFLRWEVVLKTRHLPRYSLLLLV